MCGTCGCKSAETLSKTSCCCGADEANPCACMKAPEPMECSAKAPKCACYKALEKNAEFLYYYVLNEKGESPADFNTLEEAQTYVANSSEPLEIYERRSRDDEAYKMDKKMNAETFDDVKIKYDNRDRIFFIKSVDYDTDGEIENDELPQEFTIKIPSNYHYFDEDADEREERTGKKGTATPEDKKDSNFLLLLSSYLLILVMMFSLLPIPSNSSAKQMSSFSSYVKKDFDIKFIGKSYFFFFKNFISCF